MNDPLSLLRQEVQAGGSLELKDGYYTLGGYRLSQDISTAFKRSVKAVEDYYYTLKDLIYCYENANLQFSEYRKNSIHVKVKGLGDGDRAALLAYLSGSMATVPQIDSHVQASWVAPEPIAEKTKQGSRSHRDETIATGSFSQTESRRAKRKADEMGQTAADAVDKANSSDLLEKDRVALKEIMRDCFPVLSSKAMVYSAAGDEDFKTVLKIFNEAVLKPQQQQPLGAEDTLASSSIIPGGSATVPRPLPAENTSANGRSQSLRPIIIVPAALTSRLNMANAKTFLEIGRFSRLTDEQVRDLSMGPAASRKRTEVVLRQVPGGDSLLQYRLTDDPQKLAAADWGRVAAVFVTGQVWQFSQWPAAFSAPVQLCQQVLVLHLAMTGDQLPSTVQAWAVKVLWVDQFKEHVNAKAQGEFWRFLDDFIRLKKPQLIGSVPR